MTSHSGVKVNVYLKPPYYGTKMYLLRYQYLFFIVSVCLWLIPILWCVSISVFENMVWLNRTFDIWVALSTLNRAQLLICITRLVYPWNQGVLFYTPCLKSAWALLSHWFSCTLLIASFSKVECPMVVALTRPFSWHQTAGDHHYLWVFLYLYRPDKSLNKTKIYWKRNVAQTFTNFICFCF